MLVNSDHKDLFFSHIRNSGYSPNSVRILRSDILSLFTWLQAQDFSVAIGEVISKYERFLILNRSPYQTIARKISSTNKFVNWFYSELPSNTLKSQTVKSDSKSTRTVQMRASPSRALFLHAAIIAIFMCTLSVIFLAFSRFFLESAFVTTQNSNSNRRQSSSIHFDLQINSPLELTPSSKDKLQFKLYSLEDESYVIGYVQCSLANTTIPEGSSRLQIDISSNCTSLSSEIQNKIERGDAISADIYLNSQKLTESKVLINNPISANADSNYQYALHDSILIPSNRDTQLPEIVDSGDVLGLEIANQSFTTNVIPFSVFHNSSTFNDGDIVAIYNDNLVRALLSTKVLGVVAGDSIITQGIAYVRVIQSPDTMISSGDYISTSTQAGYGQKAISEYDSIVGVALEPLIPGNEYLKVLVSLP